MVNKNYSCFRRFLLIGVLVGGLLCILLAGVSYISNLMLPSHSENTSFLSNLDKARLAEAIHLRQALGDSVWSGWGKANIPTIIYNEEYAFLVGLPEPSPGWIKVPANTQKGGPWEAVQEDTFQGVTYYRQRLADRASTPQAFTVLVGDRWVASLTTKEWMEISLAEPIREDLPFLLHPVLPYKLFCRLLVGDSDRYISLILHEAFHAYEGQVAVTRLERAEQIMWLQGEKYPWDNPNLEEAWKVEQDLLVKAIRSNSQDETIDLVRQFLAQRQVRRTSQGLSPEMIAYENLREWEEGLSKYTEMEIWRQAAIAPGYRPDPGITSDKGFKNYTSFEKHWQNEVSNVRNTAEDSRLYYTGMAQAFLLDRLMPGWKEQIFQEEITLEDLMREAIK